MKYIRVPQLYFNMLYFTLWIYQLCDKSGKVFFHRRLKSRKQESLPRRNLVMVRKCIKFWCFAHYHIEYKNCYNSSSKNNRNEVLPARGKSEGTVTQSLNHIGDETSCCKYCSTVVIYTLIFCSYLQLWTKYQDFL